MQACCQCATRPVLLCYAEVIAPPLCAKRPHELHGPEGTNDVRHDDYYWLRDDEREDNDVLAHLEVHLQRL